MNHGPLTDLPDYSFTDGRQTPYGSMQYTRLQEQKLIAVRIFFLFTSSTSLAIV